MATTDARPVPKKNVAYRLYFEIRKSDGTLITTWAGQDTELSLDGGNYADATNEATEIQTSGTGYIDLTAAEMNYDCVIVKTTVTNTGALPFVAVLFPTEAADIPADVSASAVASVSGAVGSVTGNVGGNVSGSVGSVASYGTLVADVAAAVWNALTSGMTTVGSIGKKLADWVVGTLADDAITSAKFDESTAFPLKSADTGTTQVARTGADGDTLKTLSDQLDGLLYAGAGARTVSLLVDDDSSNLLEGVVVRLTKGVTSLRQLTDASGECTFNCDDGDWVVAASLAGYSYAGSTLTVDGDESLPITMTQVAIAAASDPALCNCYLYTYNAQGAIEATVAITFQLLTPPGGDGKAYDGDTFDASSDGAGLLEIELMRGATYRARREADGSWVEFTVPFEDAWPLPRMLGG